MYQTTEGERKVPSSREGQRMKKKDKKVFISASKMINYEIYFFELVQINLFGPQMRTTDAP